MSDSVGKISLDLEVQTDLSGQMEQVSAGIGKKLEQSLGGGVNGVLGMLNKSIEANMQAINTTIKTALETMKSNSKEAIESILSLTRNIKVPTPRVPDNNQVKPNIPEITPTIPRGPPVVTTPTMPKMVTPKVDIGISKESLKAQIANVEATLDNVNAKIEQQQEKLAQLRESYSQTFNQVRKNKIEEQMLKTEAAINRLIGQSDKLGFQLASLDGQYSSLGSSVGKADEGTSKLSNSMKSLEHNTKRAGNSAKSAHSDLGSFFGRIIKYRIVMAALVSGIRHLGSSLLASLNTNTQFANSLAVVKTNLQVAFMPIYTAILPAINALMSALATATTYIASFISSIFGKTYKQSYQATQGLIDAKAAMGAYGDTTEKAAKQAKKAQCILAGFDEINTLNLDKDEDDSGSGSSGGGGGANIPVLTAPAVDTSSIDNAMSKITDKFKAFINTINFQPLINSFDNLKKSVEPIVKNLGKILKWFMTDILAPLTKWTIEDFLPAFFNLLAGAFNFLNPILEVFMSLGKWLWDEFLQPIAAWTGGVIVSILNGLADALTRIGQWISEHKTLVEDITLVILSFAAAWGVVKLALEAYSIAMTIYNGISWLCTYGATALGIALLSVNWPIVIAVAIIGSLIAIGVLLYKNWDTIKAKAIEVFEFIKNWISEKCTQIGDFFSNLREVIHQKFSDIGSWFSEKFTAAKEGVCNAFATVGNWFGDRKNDICNAFSNVHTWFGDKFGSARENSYKAFAMVGNWFGNKKQDICNAFASMPGWFNNKFTEAKNNVCSAFSPVKGFFGNLFSGIKDIFNNIGTVVGGALSGAFKAAVNGVLRFAGNHINGFISAINGAIGIINKIPGVNIGRLTAMAVPQLAKGAILDSPTLAMVGEAGKEAVMPLENNTGWISDLAQKVADRMPQGNNNNSNTSDKPVTVILKVGQTEFGRTVINSLNEIGRQNGGEIPLNI